MVEQGNFDYFFKNSFNNNKQQKNAELFRMQQNIDHFKGNTIAKSGGDKSSFAKTDNKCKTVIIIVNIKGSSSV